jgi:hypothetical protein
VPAPHPTPDRSSHPTIQSNPHFAEALGEYLARIKRKYAEAGRPTYTKLDLAQRLREDRLQDNPDQ